VQRFRFFCVLGCTAILLIGVGAAPVEGAATKTLASRASLMQGAYRFERANWVYVHLEGSPRQIGFQHGWLLAPEISDALAAVKLEETHDTKRDWSFFRKTAQNVLWPHIEQEYREELRGIAEGAVAHGARLDLWDIVAINAKEEVPDYYVPWLDAEQKRADAPRLRAPGNCSAFVATGAWTKDGKPVIAHNSWTSYLIGERWRIVFDIVPAKGQRILMDGFPGAIASGDDYGLNAAQLAVTETTITGYASYDPAKVPEFVRARKALQYASSIDEFTTIFLDRNNGGYANDWLLADYKTGEIARFEVGLKLHRIWRTKDGYYAGANYPSDPEFIKAETDFDPLNDASSPNARRKRWDELMAQSKGGIDAETAQKLLADHWDSFQRKEEANERTICGHVHASARGVHEWEWGPFTPGGGVSAKVADSSLMKRFAFSARSGLPCGEDFLAKQFLSLHPEYSWQQAALRDMKGTAWAEFKTGDHAQ
jgi:hypothetical protein